MRVSDRSSSMSGKAKLHRPGFTLVELLIVIVVIAILATIAIVSYRGIQGRAHDVAISSDLRNIASSLEVYYADHGRYPGLDEETQSSGSVDRILTAITNSDMPAKFTVGSYGKFFDEVENGHFLIGYTRQSVGAGTMASKITAICMMFASKSGNGFLFSTAKGVAKLGKVPLPLDDSFTGVQPNSFKYYCQQSGGIEDAESITYGGRYVDSL